MSTPDSVIVYTDEEISAQLQAIVREAKEYVVIVTPFLKLWKHIENELELALKRGIKILVILRDDKDGVGGKNAKDSVAWLVGKGVKLLALENLHAKIYFNENENSVLVTSMNLHQSSAEKSREIALLIQDDKLAHQIRNYVKEQLQPLARSLSALRDTPPVQATHSPTQTSPLGVPGACIRCGRPISFNPDKPLCEDCYGSWSEWGNEDYQEAYCHACGKPSNTSKARPLCRACYSALQ